MAERLAFALANPLASARGDISPYRQIDAQPDGNLLVSILAVDR